MRLRRSIFALLALALPLGSGAQTAELRSIFRVKYVAEGVVYLDGGRSAGLEKGQRLTIKRTGLSELRSGGAAEVRATRVLGEIEVVSLAETSAVCEITRQGEPFTAGDTAYLSNDAVETRLREQAKAGARSYPVVVSFDDGDPLDEEQRAEVPRPPSPEVNRARGRIGTDYSSIVTHDGTAARSAQVGMLLHLDVSRIGGTYWNFRSNFRGRLNSRAGSAQAQTVRDLVNRTYEVGFTYANPNSKWQMGVGRLFVPWAMSLSSVDGGYLAYRLHPHVNAGFFAGSTPDPTSWNYDPRRKQAAAFLGFDGGSFQSVHFTSNFGVGSSMIDWRAERHFAYVESNLNFRQRISLYNTVEADRSHLPVSGRTDLSVARSYTTLRVQPHRVLSLDISHNYFRDIPTFDPTLISTGLVDKLLFQGFSGGGRLQLPKRIAVYGSAGFSNRTGDTHSSGSRLFGITLGNIWKTGMRGDVRYSEFDGAFGTGRYRSASLSREIGEHFRWELQGGLQSLRSLVSVQTESTFYGGTLDWFLGRHYFLESGFTLQRGDRPYDQWFTTMGYRF